jgi:hypothetical protein
MHDEKDFYLAPESACGLYPSTPKVILSAKGISAFYGA